MSLSSMRRSGGYPHQRTLTLSKLVAIALFAPILFGAPIASAEGGTSSAEDETRLQELQQDVDNLREQIRTSRTRLRSLRNRLLAPQADSSHAVIKHVNNTDDAFTLEEVTYRLDGTTLYSETNADGELSRRGEIELYNGVILPGTHRVSVQMTFVENTHALFSNAQGGRFTTRSEYAFTAERGKVAQLNVISFGDAEENQRLEERADVRYELTFVDEVAVSD